MRLGMIDLRLSPAPPHQEELPSVLADIVDFARHSWSRAQLSGRDHDILHDRGGPRAPSGTAGGQIQSQIQHTQLHGNNKSWPFSVLFLVLCMVIVVFSVFRSYLSRAEDSKTRRHLWAIILFWAFTSLAMNLLNKQATVLLACPFGIVLIQTVMAASVMVPHFKELKTADPTSIYKWCALSLVFATMLLSSLFAFSHASISALLVLRNCLPLFAVPAELLFIPTSQTPTVSVIASLFIISGGTFVYAFFSPHPISGKGVVWIVINCIASVFNRVVERRLLISPDMKLSVEAMTLINNAVPIVPILALAYATGETEQWGKYAGVLMDPMALLVLSSSSLVGLCLNQSSLLVQKCVSATSMLVLQTTNKIAVIGCAMFLFHDRFTPLSAVGCGLSLLGCFLYGVARDGFAGVTGVNWGALRDVLAAVTGMSAFTTSSSRGKVVNSSGGARAVGWDDKGTAATPRTEAPDDSCVESVGSDFEGVSPFQK